MSYIETRTLSMRKDRQKIHAVEPVYLRQGDCGAIIEGILEDNGQPFELGDNAKVTFEAVNAGGRYLTEGVTSVDVSNSTVRYTVSTLLTEKKGRAQVGYFKVDQGGDVFTSDAIPIVVLIGADMTATQAQAYESELEDLLKRLEEAIERAESGNTGLGDDTYIGSETNFIYIDSGSFVSSKTTVGSSSRPVFLSSGTIAECGTSLAVSITGNAESANTATSADKLSNARTITLNGDVSTSISFDGSKDVSSTVTLANSGVTANSYGQSSDLSPNAGETFTVPYITFDAKGRATAAANRTITLPSAQGEVGTADKLSCGDVGDTNIPVHFEDGIPQVCDGYAVGAFFSVEITPSADQLIKGDTITVTVKIRNLSRYADLTLTALRSDDVFSNGASKGIIWASPTLSSNATIAAGAEQTYFGTLNDDNGAATGEGTFTLTVTAQSDFFSVPSNTITIIV